MPNYEDMTESEFQDALLRKGQAKHDLEQMALFQRQCPWLLLLLMVGFILIAVCEN